MSIVDELGKLAELKKEGMLSDEQFERAKDQVLAASGTGVGSGDGSAGIAAALVDVLADFDRHRATFLRAQAIAREGFRRNNPVAVLSAMNPAAGQRDRASA